MTWNSSCVTIITKVKSYHWNLEMMDVNILDFLHWMNKEM
jgi:hypothetical protein